MTPDRYTVYIGALVAVAEDVPYATLLRSLVRFTVDAAVARCADDTRWEHEELRKRGLSALAICRNGKAIWKDQDSFDSELAQAWESGSGADFMAANQIDTELLAHLDRDLQILWRRAGYDVHGLMDDMKRLFVELERDLSESAAVARTALVDEILQATCS